MAGRMAWILAGGVALVGGLIYQDRLGLSWGDHRGERIVVEHRGPGRGAAEVEAATAKSLAAAVGTLVRAEARLAKLELVGDTGAAELAAARAERDRAEAEVDRLEAEIEARRAGSDKHRLRDEIRKEVREELRH